MKAFSCFYEIPIIKGVKFLDVIKRITALMEERIWTEYRLAKKHSFRPLLFQIYFRAIPSVATLETSCDAFGISMSEFFWWRYDGAVWRTKRVINQMDIAVTGEKDFTGFNIKDELSKWRGSYIWTLFVIKNICWG